MSNERKIIVSLERLDNNGEDDTRFIFVRAPYSGSNKVIRVYSVAYDGQFSEEDIRKVHDLMKQEFSYGILSPRVDRAPEEFRNPEKVVFNLGLEKII